MINFVHLVSLWVDTGSSSKVSEEVKGFGSFVGLDFVLVLDFGLVVVLEPVNDFDLIELFDFVTGLVAFLVVLLSGMINGSDAVVAMTEVLEAELRQLSKFLKYLLF